jgi:hypothetical protein
MTTSQLDRSTLTRAPATSDRFPAPIARGSQGSTLVLVVGTFRDWLGAHMSAHDLTSSDVARCNPARCLTG